MKSSFDDLKKEDLPYDSFVAGWYIPDHICDGLLDYYYENTNTKKDGIIGNGVIDKDIKDSIDIGVDVKDNTDSYVKSYLSYLNACLKKYTKMYNYIDENYHFNLNGDFNIQRYKKGGGFKKFHFERTDPRSTLRVLVFMTYLNDVDDGGTEFYYQKLKTEAKKGLTLIWPSDFTHTHKGIVSKTKEKYIATGWFTYDAEVTMLKYKGPGDE